MTRALRTLLPAVAAFASVALTGSAASAAAVTDPAPIGQNQLFIGLVNGKTADATVYVACPGPVTAGETGTAISGQYVEVEPEAAGSTSLFGYTGSAADSITAIFGPSAVANQGVVIHDYFVQVPIPSTLKLPCSGSGVVSFDPTPTSATARSFTVTVTYVNIAV